MEYGWFGAVTPLVCQSASVCPQNMENFVLRLARSTYGFEADGIVKSSRTRTLLDLMRKEHDSAFVGTGPGHLLEAITGENFPVMISSLCGLPAILGLLS